MENRLKNLRKTMDTVTFSQLKFTEKHQKEIREVMMKKDDKEDDIILAIMQLLVHEKTGFELVKHLRGRGIQKFEDNEGFLYTLLHRLEHTNCLQSNWNESGAKYYQLTTKGKKIVKRAEKREGTKRFSLQELLEG